MIRPRYRALALSLLAPLVIVAACGGDDDLFPLVDAGPDAARDSTTQESGGDSASPDAPSNPDAVSSDATSSDTSNAVDAKESGAVDAGTDARPDVGTDSSTPVDAGVDAPVDAGVDAPVDAGVDAPADTGARPDAAISDASIDVQIFDGGSCNTLANSGPAVPETRIAQDAPTPIGGSIPLGLYYLTKWEIYTGSGGATGPTGNTRKLAFYFYATTYLKVTADNGGGDENDNRSWNVQDTTLNSLQYCPTNDTLSSDYTVSGNQLILIVPPQVLTFTHQ